MKGLKHYYKPFCFILIGFFAINIAKSQEKIQWNEIILLDAPPHYGMTNIDEQNPNYPPSNLFDGDLRTCWVTGSEHEIDPSLYVKLPELNNWIINIFPGYGKSSDLYLKNARPRKVRLSVFIAINPDGGFVTEIATVYKVLEFYKKIDVELKDSFGIHSIPLDFQTMELTGFIENAEREFITSFNHGINKKCLILKLEVVDIWKGTHFNDICISELFFNNTFVTFNPLTINQITNVYINNEENALLIDDSEGIGSVVYQDKESVLQLVEVSQNNKWAILISMPSDIEGRAETFYLLVDLINKKVVNNELEQCLGNYSSGSVLFFEEKGIGPVFLIYNFENSIELK